MENYFLMSYYPVHLNKKEIKAYCISRNKEISLTILGMNSYKKNILFSGISSYHRGGIFYLLELSEIEIIVGWNDKFVYLHDIDSMQWSKTLIGRKFICCCNNALDNIKISYENIWRRWLNPIQLYEDLLMDNWEEFIDLPRQVTVQFNEDNNPKYFAKTIKENIKFLLEEGKINSF